MLSRKWKLKTLCTPLMCYWQKSVEMWLLWETVRWCLKKVKIELPCAPAILLLVVQKAESQYLYKSFLSNIIQLLKGRSNPVFCKTKCLKTHKSRLSLKKGNSDTYCSGDGVEDVKLNEIRYGKMDVVWLHWPEVPLWSDSERQEWSRAAVPREERGLPQQFYKMRSSALCVYSSVNVLNSTDLYAFRFSDSKFHVTFILLWFF